MRVHNAIVLAGIVATVAALPLRADPPLALYSGGSFDGSASTRLITYTEPAANSARFAGGSFDGSTFTERDVFTQPAAYIARFSGGSFDGSTYTERNTFTEPAAYRARFAGSSFDGHSFTERDTFDFATLSARFSGGSYDGQALTESGPYPNPLNRDTDGNGIPDWWIAPFYQTIYGPAAGADLDGDGWTTLEEYIADTDPRTAASQFAITSITFPGSNPFVNFSSSSSNRMYTVEYATNLPSNIWSPVPGQPPRLGVGGPDAFPDATNTNRANYRIRVGFP